MFLHFIDSPVLLLVCGSQVKDFSILVSLHVPVSSISPVSSVSVTLGQ
jgi:hypothetical protein